MTLDDFEASAELARVTPGTRSYSAALAVLVDGLSRNSQAKRVGISQPAVSKTCKRITTAYNLARKVTP